METEVTGGAAPVVVVSPGQPALAGRQAIVDLLGRCFEAKSRGLVLHAEQLPDGFFELRTGVAGELLQLTRTYGVRLAVVADPASLPEGHFREMAREEAEGGDFRICPSRSDAVAWLA